VQLSLGYRWDLPRDGGGGAAALSSLSNSAPLR